jgi:nucleoid DNA-binding protein
MAREAVERYLASAAAEVAQGEIVTLPSVGRLHVALRKNGGRLLANINGDRSELREPGYRVQVCFRLTDELKAQCHRNLDALVFANPGPTRVKAGEPNTNRVKPGLNPGSTNRKDR